MRYFIADPGPASHFRIRIRILIQLLFKVMRICDHWSTDPPGGSILSLQASIVRVHGPQRLYFFSRFLFWFNADSDPAFHFNEDPDPDSAFTNDSGSKSATLLTCKSRQISVAKLDNAIKSSCGPLLYGTTTICRLFTWPSFLAGPGSWINHSCGGGTIRCSKPRSFNLISLFFVPWLLHQQGVSTNIYLLLWICILRQQGEMMPNAMYDTNSVPYTTFSSSFIE